MSQLVLPTGQIDMVSNFKPVVFPPPNRKPAAWADFISYYGAGLGFGPLQTQPQSKAQPQPQK